MTQRIGEIALLVRDYQEAIFWFTQKLGFVLVADAPVPPNERWVTVAPPGGETAMRLARAETEGQRAQIGHQADERVLLYLHTDDFARDHALYTARGPVHRDATPGNLWNRGGVPGSLWQPMGPYSAQQCLIAGATGVSQSLHNFSSSSCDRMFPKFLLEQEDNMRRVYQFASIMFTKVNAHA